MIGKWSLNGTIILSQSQEADQWIRKWFWYQCGSQNWRRIICSMKAMKSGKASGKDGVIADMLKMELGKATSYKNTFFTVRL